MSGLLTAIHLIVLAVLGSLLGSSDEAPTSDDMKEPSSFFRISLEQPADMTDPCKKTHAT